MCSLSSISRESGLVSEFLRLRQLIGLKDVQLGLNGAQLSRRQARAAVNYRGEGAGKRLWGEN